MFEGFVETDIQTSGPRIHLRHGGKGPPLLLLHGNPQSHICWHKVAPRLAEHFHVVVPDLRGYGDSEGPVPDEDAANYSFRAMANDHVEVMKALGYDKFQAAGHDRGARTLHRMMQDHPDKVTRGAILDIVPNRHLWHNSKMEWAINSWHWVFMPQGGGLPERMMESVPAEWLLERLITKPGHNGTRVSIFEPEAWKEYVRCFTPKMIRASCADYRACATIDLKLDDADFGRKVEAPMLILWGRESHTETVWGDVLGLWRDYGAHVEGGKVSGGHFIPENAPDETYDWFMKFFKK